jgi:ABC-type multidrug transport system fused ATPase/permease subunit
MKIPLGSYWRLLAEYLSKQRTAVALLSILLAAGIALQLASPQILRYFIDTAVGLAGSTRAGGAPAAPGGILGIGADLDIGTRLVLAALLFIAMALIQQGVTVWSTYISETVAWTATNALRTDLARHCIELDMSFHNEHTPGELIERIDGDVAALANFFSQFVIQILGNGVLMVGILAILGREDLRLGGAMAGFALAAIVVLYQVSHVAVPKWDAARQAASDMSGFLEERLAGTEDIRSSGATQYVMRGFHEVMKTRWRAELSAGLMVNAIVNSSMLLFAIGNAAALALGAWLYVTKGLSIGSVFLVFQYSNLLFMPIERISMQLGDLQKAGAGIERIRKLRDHKSSLVFPSRQAGRELPPASLSIDFDGVVFGYRPEEPVLKGLTFHLDHGRILGLLGRTGSGKTSIARLLFRLYDPQAGTIRLGGDSGRVDLRELPRDALHRHVGMIAQEVQLFNASIRDNLTFFDPGVEDARIQSAIAGLGLAAWYEKLPDGLDTVLSSGGVGLSAGEAQLLAFIRIFLYDPGLLILDEASSRLDPATEALIEGALEALYRGRTAIVIAHRLATVRRVDDIMVLEEGNIVELGCRAALAADPGSRFAGLLKTGLEEVLA